MVGAPIHLFAATPIVVIHVVALLPFSVCNILMVVVLILMLVALPLVALALVLMWITLPLVVTVVLGERDA
jgi:hypothetical protein